MTKQLTEPRRPHWAEDERQTDLALELTRLDAFQATHWPRALRGDLKARELILDLMDQRARLLGLYQPTQEPLESDPTPAAEPATRH